MEMDTNTQITELHLTTMLNFYSPLISDTMDRLGLKSGVIDKNVQSILPNPNIKSCGLAYPCLVCQTDEYVEIDTLLEMIDSIPKNAFVVVASNTPIDAALWGGMMSARAKNRGATAAMVSGEVRDIAQIYQSEFNVFGTGRCIKDIRTRGYMKAYNLEVDFLGTPIKPNDIIFADSNGCIVIPQENFWEIYNELTKALSEENSVQSGLLNGEDAKSLFEKHNRF